MRAWPAPRRPRPARVGPAAAAARHRDRRGPADRTRARPPGCTSAASPPTTRRTSATPRPTSPSTWCTGPGSTPATTCTTCRTSPTSTTRCSSAPPRDGEDWRGAGRARDRRCSARTWPRSAVLPPRDYVGAVESIPRRRRRRPSGCASRARRTTSRATPTSRCTATRGSAASATSTTTTMLALFAERGGDPDAARQEAPAGLPALAGGPPGRAVVGRPATPSCPPAGPGWHVECAAIALQPPRRRASTCRAAAATWCSRTTR